MGCETNLFKMLMVTGAHMFKRLSQRVIRDQGTVCVTAGITETRLTVKQLLQVDAGDPVFAALLCLTTKDDSVSGVLRYKGLWSPLNPTKQNVGSR